MVLDTELNHKNFQKESSKRTSETLGSSVIVENVVEDNKQDSEMTSEKLYKLNKIDQQELLLSLGMELSEVRKLRTERMRVDKLINLTT